MKLKRIVLCALVVASLGLCGCFYGGGGWGGPAYGSGYAPAYVRPVPAYGYGGWGYHPGWSAWHGPGVYHPFHGYAVARGAGWHGYHGGYHGDWHR